MTTVQQFEVVFLDYRPLIVGFFLALHFVLWITAFEYTYRYIFCYTDSFR